MRKQLTICLMLFALLMTMAGCSAANAVRMLDAAEDQVEAKLDAAEKTLEDRLRDAVLPAPETNPAASEPSGKSHPHPSLYKFPGGRPPGCGGFF